MSQADSPNTTNLSRRRLLAGIPAVAATVAPVTATALCRLAAGVSDDPIFAIIERHRQAFEEYQAAGELSAKLREEHEAQRGPGVYLGEEEETEMIVTHADGTTCKFDADHLPTGDGDTWSDVPTGRMLPRYARLPRDIDDNVPADCADPEGWKAEKDREYWEWSTGGENSPRSKAWRAWNELHRHYILVTAELNIRPSTMAGVAALLRYMAEVRNDEENWDCCLYENDDEDDEDCKGDLIVDNAGLFDRIMETLADAVESIPA
jgi:hypothetical protein